MTDPREAHRKAALANVHDSWRIEPLRVVEVSGDGMPDPCLPTTYAEWKRRAEKAEARVVKLNGWLNEHESALAKARHVINRYQGINWHQLLGYYPSGAPAPVTTPPWGIHTEDPRDTHHGAALADDAPDRAGQTEDANPKDKAALSKVPMWSLPAIGAVHGAMSTADGIRKGYGAYNWRYKPISMMEHIGALERHIAALKDGEDFASDSKVSHLGCINAGTAIILDAHQCGTLIDDRPRPGVATAADALEAYRDRDTES